MHEKSNRPPLTPEAQEQVPQIDQIEIFELIGIGASSSIYRARQILLDRIVAVKILSKNALEGDNGAERFQREALIASNLDHPSIVRTFSHGISIDGRPYLVMEHLEGLNLAQVFKESTPLNFLAFREIFIPLLDGLEYAHELGVVHRDIKPSNIIVCRSIDKKNTAKLLDFGIAKIYERGRPSAQQLTKTGLLIGSPDYMSPEQCQGKELDGKSDLYSLSCVMYEAFSGQPVFHGESALDTMYKHINSAPPSVSDLSRKVEVPDALARLILGGLSKDCKDRPASASHFARKLNEALEGITLDRVPETKLQAAASNSKMQTLILLALLIALVLIAVLIRNLPATYQPPSQPAKSLKQSLQEADSFDAQGKFESAWSKYETLMSKPLNMTNREILLIARLNAAKSHEKGGDLQGGFTIAKQGEKLCVKKNEEQLKLDFETREFQALSALHQFQNSNAIADSILNEIGSGGRMDTNAVFARRDELLDLMIIDGNLKKARSYLEVNQKLAETNNELAELLRLRPKLRLAQLLYKESTINPDLKKGREDLLKASKLASEIFSDTLMNENIPESDRTNTVLVLSSVFYATRKDFYSGSLQRFVSSLHQPCEKAMIYYTLAQSLEEQPSLAKKNFKLALSCSQENMTQTADSVHLHKDILAALIRVTKNSPSENQYYSDQLKGIKNK